MVDRWAVARVAIVLLAALAASSAARADTPPDEAEVRADANIDAATFARAIFTRYRAFFSRIVAADIDRDGDVDVLASGDRGLVVWVNDGVGHLRSQASPRQAPAVDNRAPVHEWRDAERRAGETIQNELPDPPLASNASRAPPVPLGGFTRASLTVLTLGPERGCPTSRAPPVALAYTRTKPL